MKLAQLVIESQVLGLSRWRLGVLLLFVLYGADLKLPLLTRSLKGPPSNHAKSWERRSGLRGLRGLPAIRLWLAKVL